MTLTDAGPLIALLDSNDIHHSRCLEVVAHLPATPLLTTWPCFTEAMYLLGAMGGYRYQARLWSLYASGRLTLVDLTESDTARMMALMETYQDRPMDMADASLVAVAESRALHLIFTLDSDFHIYRLAGGTTLDVIPN